MSRSGYCDDDYGWRTIMWRGAVTSAIRGRKGQAFLKELLEALDGLPEPKLYPNELVIERVVDLESGATTPQFCALGAVGKKRGIDMSKLDPDDRSTVAYTFGIAEAMAAEIMYENDEYTRETPEDRFIRMRKWVKGCIKNVDE